MDDLRPTMPDDLRTRIANAIWEELRTQNNLVNFDRLADAVIAELGLKSYKSNESQKPLNFDLRTSEEWGCLDFALWLSEEPMTDNLSVKPDAPLVRYWDHNFNEVFPPDNFDHVTVDQADVRWHCRVMERFKLKNGGKSDD